MSWTSCLVGSVVWSGRVSYSSLVINLLQMLNYVDLFHLGLGSLSLCMLLVSVSFSSRTCCLLPGDVVVLCPCVCC